jgi:hypothetical protein
VIPFLRRDAFVPEKESSPDESRHAFPHQPHASALFENEVLDLLDDFNNFSISRQTCER